MTNFVSNRKFKRPSILRKLLRESIRTCGIEPELCCKITAMDINTSRPSLNKKRFGDISLKSNSCSEEMSEVKLRYNSSNIPKYYGKFANIRINGNLRRQCIDCKITYNDLKGFNRHYQSIHLKIPRIKRKV